MNTLHQKCCVPCRKGTATLASSAQESLLKDLHADWRIVDGHHLHRDFRFPNFVEALAFVNQVGHLAESEGHHPNISLTWGHVGIDIFTHVINGLHENDFILASKIDRVA